MPSIQTRNDELQGIVQSDLVGNGFRSWHEPIGDFGVWNGQFETGPGSGSPDGWPEGWELYPDNATSSITRVAGGWAGNWCMKGGNTNPDNGGFIRNLRYIPVSESRGYYLAGAFRADTAAETVSLGVECYSAAKVLLGTVWALAAYAPGVAWVERQLRVGPNGDVALLANTRYVRVVVYLQNNKAIAGYAYCDDIQFQQMKTCYSSGLSYINNRSYSASTQVFTLQSYVSWVATRLVLTAEEPSYICYAYYGTGYGDVARSLSAYIRVYVDGVSDTGFIDAIICQPVANYNMPIALVGRTVNVYGRGTHTIELYVYVAVAGDTWRGLYAHSFAYLIRAY